MAEVCEDHLLSSSPQHNSVSLSNGVQVESRFDLNENKPSHLIYDFADNNNEKLDRSDEASSQDSILTTTTYTDEKSTLTFGSSSDEICTQESLASSSDENHTKELRRTRSILKTCNSCCQHKNLRTSFSTLEIREYSITLGDNPGGRQGPPLSLDWDYDIRRIKIHKLDEYEKKRSPRRTESALHIPHSKRMWILMERNNVTLSQLEKASKEARIVRTQRQRSVKLHMFYQRYIAFLNRLRRLSCK